MKAFRILSLIFCLQFVIAAFGQEQYKRVYRLKANDVKVITKLRFDSLTEKEKKALIKSMNPLLGKIAVKKIEKGNLTLYDTLLIDIPYLKMNSWPAQTEADWNGRRNFYIETQKNGTLKAIPKLPRRIRNQKLNNSKNTETSRAEKIINNKLDSTKSNISSLFINNEKWKFISDARADNNDYVINIEPFNHEWLGFWEVSFNPIVIPIKYRTKRTNVPIAATGNSEFKRIEEFSANFNINAAFGLSYGNTRFARPSKGNEFKTTTWKLTGSFILGFTPVALNNANTNNARSLNPNLDTDINRTVGALTLGGGIMYAIDNFNFGVFVGLDHARGQSRDEWDYQNRMWLGIGLGYSLFKL
ncbi:hypothetical protein [Croceivirga thetidis]|uniref:DUF3575 domain-containing protein n=1 Tax=Croceivirga thetidis TaxID=2721623 RepID=A0ABX1GW88_9FLAO|nr:hypothetical protein [Croceivirga thetidis]NKI33150.1 hypothetical protein [Croceivirga thetidis]